MDPLSYMNHLDPLQLQAAEAPAGKLLVLGGPGAGKTEVLLARLMRSLLRHPRRGRVRFVAVGGVGAHDVMARLRGLPSSMEDLAAQCIVTPPLLANLVLRLGGAGVVGREPSYTIWSRSQARQMFTEVVRSAGSERTLAPAEIDSIHQWHRRRKAGVPGIGNAGEMDRFRHLPDRYEDLKKMTGCLDEDDLVLLAAQALEENDALRNRFCVQEGGHLLVDDFHALTPEALRMLCLIGGDAGSITVAVTPNFPADEESLGIPDPVSFFQGHYQGAEIRRLTRTYRHSEAIAGTLAGFAAHESTPGLTAVRLESDRHDGPAPVIAEVGDDPVELANFIQDSALGLVRQGHDLTDLACICRDPDLVPRLEAELEQRGIPCNVLGNRGSQQQPPAVERATNLLAWLLNPGDRRAFTSATFSGPDAPPEGAVRQIVNRIFEESRVQRRHPVQVAEEMAQHLDPVEATHGMLMWAVEAHEQLAGQMAGSSPLDLVMSALELCEADLSEDSPVQRSDLVETAQRLGTDDPYMGHPMQTEVLDLCQPDLSLDLYTAPTGLTLTTVHDARNRYWRAAIVVDTEKAGEDQRDRDRQVFMGLSHATDQLIYLAVVKDDGRSDGSTGGYHRVLQESMERGAGGEPVPDSPEISHSAEPEFEPPTTRPATTDGPVEPGLPGGRKPPVERRRVPGGDTPATGRTRPPESGPSRSNVEHSPGSVRSHRVPPSSPATGTDQRQARLVRRAEPAGRVRWGGRGEFPISFNWPCIIAVIVMLAAVAVAAAVIIMSLKGLL